jgi:protein-S-isoprenylcysteine O-methyltransferase Ste14
MTVYDYIAGAVLWANLPVPIYWLVLHTRVEFWRRRIRAAYATAIVTAWGSVSLLGWKLAPRLLEAGTLPWGRKLAGSALVLVDALVLVQVERQLGAHRLIGHAELAGRGEIKTDGFYARVRHPRYAAMMLSTLGACLIAAGPALWAIAAGWACAVLLMIRMEERELLARFGEPYADYCRRVPALLPGLGRGAP